MNHSIYSADRSTHLKIVVVALVAGIAVAVAIRRPERKSDKAAIEQRFHVRGEVRGVDAQSKLIRIKHEEIPNYMAAMTMTFRVKDSKLLDGFKPGDRVEFTLEETPQSVTISSIKKKPAG